MNQKRIWIAGSANMDVVISLDRVPAEGESVIVNSRAFVPGGKGANRAVALARLGGDTVFSCCLGTDAYGQTLADLYESENMDMSAITRLDGQGTGTAYILLESDGANRIAVYPGANDLYGTDNIDFFARNITDSELLCAELEIPLTAVERLISLAVKNDVPAIIDAGPVKKGVNLNMFKGAYILSPNETEAYMLTGIKVENEDSAREACRAMYDCGVKYALLKWGSHGSMCYDGSEFYLCPTFNRAGKVVDTTAAGDSYMAGLCKALSDGRSIKDAMRYATVVAGIAVTRFGAIPSLPHEEEVNKMIKKYPTEAGINVI